MLKTYKRLYYNELREELNKHDTDSFIQEESDEEDDLIFKEPIAKRSASENVAKPIGFSPLGKNKRPQMNVLTKTLRKNSRNEDYSMYEYPRLIR